MAVIKLGHIKATCFSSDSYNILKTAPENLIKLSDSSYISWPEEHVHWLLHNNNEDFP